MRNPYGYIKRTNGADGEHVDVYLGPNPETGNVFVVDQTGLDGRFDEHKVIIGANSQQEAEAIYDAHFSDGLGPQRRGAITGMDVEAFKADIEQSIELLRRRL